MKTIKEYLEKTDRKRILDAIAYETRTDWLYLKEHGDISVNEIVRQYTECIDTFINRLVNVETAPSDRIVCYLYESCETGMTKRCMDVCNLTEIAEDIDASGYDISFTRWEKSLGYLVADNKLTQDCIEDLLVQYLEAASMLGWTRDRWEKRRQELVDQVNRGYESAKNGERRPAEEVFNDLCEKYGFPVPEEDEVQDALLHAVFRARWKYDHYSRTRERQRILNSLKDSDKLRNLISLNPVDS